MFSVNRIAVPLRMYLIKIINGLRIDNKDAGRDLYTLVPTYLYRLSNIYIDDNNIMKNIYLDKKY